MTSTYETCDVLPSSKKISSSRNYEKFENTECLMSTLNQSEGDIL